MKTHLDRLTDRALVDEVKRLAGCEREAVAQLVLHLAEMDERKLYLEEGCASLFTFCTQVLHLAESIAYVRIEVARAVRRFPALLQELTTGGLNLTTLRLIVPELTEENHLEVIAAARHRSKCEVEKLVARLHPKPDVPSRVRKQPAKPAAASPALDLQNHPESPGQRPAAERPVIASLAPERYKIQFTADAATHAKLRRVQDLLRHRIPDGDLARVFGAALDITLEQLEKRKLGATEKPRPGKPAAPGSRTIPVHVRREVFERDGGRCAFVAANGKRCTETGGLEFHHRMPYAEGGEATTSNIGLRCRAHNAYEAVLDFGPDVAFVREAAAIWS